MLAVLAALVFGGSLVFVKPYLSHYPPTLLVVVTNTDGLVGYLTHRRRLVSGGGGRPVVDVLAALDAEGIPAADVGSVSTGSGFVVDGEETDHPGVGPFWGAMAEYGRRLAEED
jgi:hypothetical protein